MFVVGGVGGDKTCYLCYTHPGSDIYDVNCGQPDYSGHTDTGSGYVGCSMIIYG